MAFRCNVIVDKMYMYLDLLEIRKQGEQTKTASSEVESDLIK